MVFANPAVVTLVQNSIFDPGDTIFLSVYIEITSAAAATAAAAAAPSA